MKPFSLALAVLAAAAVCHGETVKDRAGAIRSDRAAMETDVRWNYNDIDRGFARARQSGKPLLVVLRCVPCLACQGIDSSVLTDKQLAPLLDEFVCVRVINANTLDLSRFQFDYDLSLSAMMFNADGTVYGRYGSWTHQKNALDKTTTGFKRALEEALLLHKNYPANKQQLAGKQPIAIPFKDPLELPELAGKYTRQLDWEGKVVQSCVHCHQVGDAIRSYYRQQNKAVPEQWIYPMPAPETIGVSLAADSVARVAAVTNGSSAAKAGLQVGDEIITFAGQPLVSIADVAWALHCAPESGTLAAEVKRAGTTRPVNITLEPGWRMKSDIARRVGTWPMRAMALGGLQLTDLNASDRAERKLPADSMALLVKHLGQYGQHAAAKNAGFRQGDVLLQVDGKSARATESELIGILLRDRRRGERVKVTVLRGTEQVPLFLPMQ